MTSPLAASNVESAAAEAGASLDKAVKRKLRDTEEACRQEKSEATSQLFGKVSLTLMRCNSMMLSARQQDSDIVSPEIDSNI